MSLEYQSKLNQLLVLGKKNGLFFSDWLRKNGYSDQLIRKYRQSGWLATLDKGVMYRTGDSLSSFAALSCYNEQLNKLNNYYINNNKIGTVNIIACENMKKAGYIYRLKQVFMKCML